MHKYIKVVAKFTAGIALAAGLAGWHFADNIRGYYRFKEVCGKEAGLWVSTKLDKDVGWWSEHDHIGYARIAAESQSVAFVRYRDSKDGNLYDVRYESGSRSDESSYQRVPADLGRPVIYSWKYINEAVAGELRLGRSGYEIRDARSKQLVARFYYFGYSKFAPDRTILASPSGEACGNKQLWTDDNITRLFVN